MPALPAKLSLHLNCKQQFLWQFSVVLLVVVAVQNRIKPTCNSCLWHVQSSIFLPCARASLASWFVAAAPLRFAMPNMQRHYLSINTRPKCSNCNCNCNHSSNNNNNSKSNSTLWHETHSTPGLVVCARFVGPQLWKFFKWCQIARCGHFLILILLLPPLLVLWSCPSWFFHMESQLETRFWRFLFAVFGSMANVCLGSFFCQPASISLPSSFYTYPLSIWSKEKHKRRI